MRYLRIITLVALIACIAAGCLLVAGCGDSNGPEATVEEIVRLARGADPKGAEGMCDEPGIPYFLQDAIPDASMPAIGEVTRDGEDSATVELLMNPMRPDAGGFLFTMRREGDTWKAAKVTIKEPQ